MIHFDIIGQMTHELEVTTPIEEIDPNYQQFLEQIRNAGRIAVQLGQRSEHNSIVTCQAATSINSGDIYRCQTIIYKPKGKFPLDFDISLGRYFPEDDQRRARVSPWKLYSAIRVRGSGLIQLDINSHLVPECGSFEKPTPDSKFPKPQQIFYNYDPSGTLDIRGPITSLVPKTRSFLYSFTDRAMREILAA